MGYKEIVTMLCDPPWDPWTLDENAQTSNAFSGAWGHSTLGTSGVDLEYRSVLPVDGDLTVTISSIKDPELDDNGNPKDPTPTQISIEGSVSGVRKGDTFSLRFETYDLSNKVEGQEYTEDQLIGDRVKGAKKNGYLVCTISSLTHTPIGPVPAGDVQDVNNMFWQNDAMDCKASGGNESLRRLGSRDPDANWLIDSPKNQWDSYCGWELLFTGDTPNKDGRQSGKHPKKGTCLQLATNNMISRDQGVLLGDWRAHQTKETARWMNPTGVQFEWTTRNTLKDNAKGIRLSALWLIYKEMNDGVPRYAPIYDRGRGGAQGEYVWERNDIGAEYHRKGVYGRFRGSLSAEDIVQVNERDAVCIAMLLMFNNNGQGANYYNIIDIYNFTFLFYNASGTIDEFTGLPITSDKPTLSTKSRVIVPAPFAMSEWDSGNFPIF